MPAQARKSSAPAASPSRKRPPLSSCSVTAVIAISAGWSEYGLSTHVPSEIRDVAAAAAASSTGADAEEQVVGDPDLVELQRLGEPGELDELVDRHVVVEPQAEARRASATVRRFEDHGVDLDLDEEVVADEAVDEHMVLAGLTEPSAAACAADAAAPVGRGNEEDARAHDVVDGPPRRSTAASAWRSAADRLRTGVTRGANAPPAPSLAVVPLTVIEWPAAARRGHTRSSCSCPPPSKNRSGGRTSSCGHVRPRGVSTVTHLKSNNR